MMNVLKRKLAERKIVKIPIMVVAVIAVIMSTKVAAMAKNAKAIGSSFLPIAMIKPFGWLDP